MKKDFLERFEEIDTKLERLAEELSELKYEDYYQEEKPTVKDLKNLLEAYDDDQELKIFAEADDAQYDLEFEGVGGIQGEDRVYIYAKEY